MQVDKNGIAIQTPGKRHKRKREPLTESLEMRRFELIDDEAEVEVVVPYLSPILEVLKRDGWREIR